MLGHEIPQTRKIGEESYHVYIAARGFVKNACYPMAPGVILVIADIRRKSMKKILILVLVLVAISFPLAAKTNLINIGYNVQGDFWGFDGVKLRSISLNSINLKGDTTGFYYQINPYFGLSFKNEASTVFKLSDYDEMVVGSNFILGYGGDLNFGPMGVLLGGGAFFDVQYYDFGSYTFTMLSGLGLGAHFYFQPGSGNFVVNAGLTLAWHPWAYEIYETDSGSYTNYSMTTANFNIGVGWRTGGIGSKRSTSEPSGGGSDDDW